MNVYFGDSISGGGSVLGTGGIYWPYVIAAKSGARVQNNSRSGHMAADQADLIYSYTPSSSDAVFYMIGANDERIYGMDAGKLQNFSDILAAELAWLTFDKQTAKSPAWTYTGTWGDTAAYGLGRYSDQAGATATFQFTGDTLALGYIIQDTVTGGFNLSVGGGSPVTVTTGRASAINTLHGRTYATALYLRSGFGPGTHTAVVTVNGWRVYMEWFATSPNGVRVIAPSIPRQSAAGYAENGGSDANVTAYNIAADNVASSLISLGASIVRADVHGYIDPTADLMPDGLHPHNCGQLNAAAAVQAVL